jgi:hypothetical protein
LVEDRRYPDIPDFEAEDACDAGTLLCQIRELKLSAIGRRHASTCTRRKMCPRFLIESERARTEVGELARVDRSAHQSGWGVCIGVQYVVADLVCNRPSEHDAESMFVGRGKVQQTEVLTLVDDALGARD